MTAEEQYVAESLAALQTILSCEDEGEIGLCDMDGGHPDEGGCSPYQSDKLKAALNLARAAIDKAMKLERT